MSRAIKTGLVIMLACLGVPPRGIAATPFRPADPEFVIAELPAGAARARNRVAGLLLESRKHPRAAAQLAQELLDQARTTAQPQLYGRAEKVLAPWVTRPDAPTALLLMEADILQQRHEFPQATELLDRIISIDSRSVRARLLRANTYIVTGQFNRARPDCAWLMGAGDSWTGTVCLSQVLGSTGQIDRARTLLDGLLRVSHDGSTTAPELIAWALSVRADLAVRVGALSEAQACWDRAVRLMPSSDYLRLALADVLIAQGHGHEASMVLDTTRSSVGALLRRVEALDSTMSMAERERSLAELQERLAVSAQRGERTHLREEARLALDLAHDSAQALTLARDNFTVQKETEDIRILARAATAARDRAALGQLEDWIRHTGYQDVVVERLLKSERS